MVELSLKIGDLKSTDLLYTNPKETLQNVVRKMRDEKQRYTVVVKDRKINGFITESKILDKIVLEGLSVDEANAEDVMEKQVVTIDSELYVADAARMMREKKSEHLFVKEGGKIVGIISANDLIDVLPTALKKK